LRPAERAAVLAAANCAEFRDKSPRQIVPTLADRGEYIASESTFYRVLHEENLMQHRPPARPPSSNKPKEHVARAPNQVWCWDITYLRSSVRGAFYYLYLIVDIYSRKIVGWWVAAEESMDIASTLIERATREHAVRKGNLVLVLHADNGGPTLGTRASPSRPSMLHAPG
jgi:transposase InsO family protein